ncbi:MAG TPA: MarP family serine protease [Candidatus Saccharimonadales bacterium]|nr:MarP family serine protease [Candidatus Saccharimonadales bacterium]
MNLIDVVIILLLITTLVHGAQIGSVRQICSTLGFFGGLFLGAWLGPHIVHFAHSPSSRSWLTLIFTLSFALLFLGIGEYVGVLLKKKLSHRYLDHFDSVLGSLVGAGTLLIAIWFGAAVLTTLPFPGLQNEIRSSTIVGFLDKDLPPAPGAIADLSHVIAPNGFPKVFNGTEPVPVNRNVALPTLGSLTAAIDSDAPSVVKIEGTGCGGIVEGSGFVVAPGLVATNAHVVAGVASPEVLDKNGMHHATVIWFDPNLDFAVLSVNNLAGKPLSVSTSTASNGTASSVLGYPGGGNFSAVPAAVLDSFIATGSNIYDQGNTNRPIYEIKANVIPGNSGGPLITRGGTVIGIVFAESTAYNQVGYALNMQQPMNELHQAEQAEQPVSTGACAE